MDEIGKGWNGEEGQRSGSVDRERRIVMEKWLGKVECVRKKDEDEVGMGLERD